MGLFKKKIKDIKNEHQEQGNEAILQMVTTYGEHYMQWDGKIYNSDIIQACIRPKIKAIGKLVAKHIRGKGEDMQVNPDAYIRFLLSEPNPYMTGQKLQEKAAAQLCYNNNAFILVVRDDNGKAMQLYPIPCVTCETVYIHDVLHLKFYYRNGKNSVFPYSDIIHLRQNYNTKDIFGDSPMPAIANMMDVIGTIDQGLIKAIKNSGIVRWLLKFNSSLRSEDIKQQVKDFADNYLSVESETFGAAGTDAKADVQRIEPKDYVPNSMMTKEVIKRIYSFFNTNEDIVQSNWTENQWNAYFEAEIAPVAIEMGDTYSVKIFSRKERGFGNRIVFDANNLQCASLSSKLDLDRMVDRGAMLVNEWREAMNMAPIAGGDKPIRRLDTQVVDLIEKMICNINDNNYKEIAQIIKALLEGGVKDDTQDRYKGCADTE